MATVSKLTDIVSDETVRQLLGVSEQELPDGRVDTPLYFSTIKAGLRNLDSRIWVTYLALKDETAGPAGSEEIEEKRARFIDALEAFVGWRTAVLFSTILPMIGVKTLTDGKASFTRESGAVSASVSMIANEMAMAQIELMEAALDLLSEAVVVVAPTGFMGTFTPSAFNPITG